MVLRLAIFIGNIFDHHLSTRHPVVSVGVNVLCAESEEEVALMLASLERWRKDGLRGPIPKAGNEKASFTNRALP